MVCVCVLRVFVCAFGSNVFVWFNCDVWRDVVWPVLRVLCLKSCGFNSFFVICGVLCLRVCVARFEVVCVFVCILLCVVYVCGGCEVLGDVVWCVFGCVFCCVCVCFYV